MSFIPPLGASPPPVLSEATPAAPGRQDSPGDMQALFESLDYSKLQSEFTSNSEVMGALGAQGTATLRDFLTRLKKANNRVESYGGKESNPEAGDAAAPLHGGPAREP